MQAFHNDQKIKDFYLNRVIEHKRADEIIQGKYWENGKGCAVGCTIHGSDHYAYELELGVPAWLAIVEDRIFEGLSKEEAKEFPEQFLTAIPVGVDLEQIKIPFLIFILESVDDKFDHEKNPKVKKVIDGVLSALKSGEKPTAAAAYTAAAAAYTAAYAAAYTDAAAAADATDAAAAAAADAADAAYAAADAAYAAAYAAEARRSAYTKFAKKLIELLENAK